MKAQDLKNKPPNILIYGPVGTFKTGLVSQASRGYMFDFDDGMKIALKYQDKFTPLRHQIEFDTYLDTNPTNPDAWLRAKKKIISIVSDIQANKWPFDALVVDSFTGMGKAIHLHVMKCAGDAFRKPEIQHWGGMINELEMFLTMIRACKVLRLSTAHQLTIERTKPGSILPFLDHTTPLSVTKPHSDDKLPWLFDEIWYSSTQLVGQGKVNFRVDGKSGTVNRSKTRSGLIGPIAHNEIGLEGLLSKVGYAYAKKS